MDRLFAMEVFVRTAERLSFTRAAEDLDLSRSVVTAQVQALERRLGVQLLRRTTRTIALTDDGRAYLERVRAILADIAETEEMVTTGRGTPRGRLRVQVPVGLARVALAPAMAAFAAKHPEVTVVVLARDRFPNFIEEGIDAAVYVGDLPDLPVIARPLGRVPLVTCAAPGYLAAKGEPRSLEDLRNHSCVQIYSHELGGALPWYFEVGGEVRRLEVGGRLYFDLSEAAIAAAVSGAGLVHVICYLLDEHLRARRLRPVLEHLQYRGPAVSIIYPRQRHLSGRTRAFVSHVADLGLAAA
jgi:LysR family transcriptional regulator for bpeEF and oprC